MRFKSFYDILMPKIVSRIIQITQSSNITEYKKAYAKDDVVFRLGSNEIYEIHIYKSEYEKTKNIKVSIIEKINYDGNELENKNLIFSTLFLDEEIIKEINHKHPDNILIYKNTYIAILSDLIDFCNEIKIDNIDEVLLLINNDLILYNQELLFNLQNLLALPYNKKNWLRDHYIDDGYFEYNIIESNDEYILSCLQRNDEIYVIEKDKNEIKFVKEYSILSAMNNGFYNRSYLYFKTKENETRISDDEINQKWLSITKEYIKSKEPNFQSKDNNIINDDIGILHSLNQCVNILYKSTKTDIPFGFNEQNINEVIEHAKYNDLNNMYVDWLWNPETETKWVEGENGYYLKISKKLFNYSKSENIPIFLEDTHTASLPAFNKKSSILKIPKNINPEWKNFVKNAYLYVSQNHNKFKFSLLSQDNIDQVTKKMKTMKII